MFPPSHAGSPGRLSRSLMSSFSEANSPPSHRAEIALQVSLAISSQMPSRSSIADLKAWSGPTFSPVKARTDALRKCHGWTSSDCLRGTAAVGKSMDLPSEISHLDHRPSSPVSYTHLTLPTNREV